MILKPTTHKEWLTLRQNGIGGSDAGAVLGVNKYKNNVRLWEEKTGKFIPEDISDKPAVLFGKTAEAPVRDLFKLDFPQYGVGYHEFYMYVNDDHPFIFATLDGELTDSDGRRGVLEIKTCTIQNKLQWNDWETPDGRPVIPQSYYVQLLHQLAATGWDFAALRAYIRFYRNGELRISIRNYFVERSEVQTEIDYLIEKESAFWKCVGNKVQPPLILPGI